MRNASNDADLDEGSSLYDMIVDATGIEYPGEFTNAEDYKNNLVRYFGRMEQEEFDALDEDVRDWVNEATGVFNDNRRAKERVPLPDIDGMPTPPPPKPRSVRVSVIEDDEDEEEVVAAPPPPPARRPRVVAAPPIAEDEDEDEVEEEPEPEPEPAPPPRRARRTPAATPAPAAPKPPRQKRDPDSGRYAKVMPHYLKDRDIDVEALQIKIEKTDGASYSETTLDRTLAACRSVVGWLERNGVNLDQLSR